jgi:ketosteroid isomerase-like protein
MKRALLTLGFGVLALATLRAELPAPVKSLVEAERAFAAAATAKGQKDAFLEYLANDSLLFRPGPVPGKMFYRTRPVPPGLLSWAPVFVDVAASGDYGLTSGPFEFRKEGSKPTDAPVGYGHFMSIWRKQADGAWRVEVDLGISHDKFTKAVSAVTDADMVVFKAPAAPKKAPVRPAATKPAAPPADAAASAAATPGGMPAQKPRDPQQQELIDVDTALAKAAAADGLVKAYRAAALDDVRIYRSGQFPVVGKKLLEKGLGGASASAPAPVAGVPLWEAAHARVASSGDWGYTTGGMTPVGAAAGAMGGGAQQPRQYYVHVYRRDASGAWKLMLDIAP